VLRLAEEMTSQSFLASVEVAVGTDSHPGPVLDSGNFRKSHAVLRRVRFGPRGQTGKCGRRRPSIRGRVVSQNEWRPARCAMLLSVTTSTTGHCAHWRSRR